MLAVCGAAGTAQRRGERRHPSAMSVAAEAQWLEFRSPTGDFTARFPDEPWERSQTITDDSSTAHVRTFGVTDTNAAYQIARSDFADPVASRAEMRDLYDERRATNLEDDSTRSLSQRAVRLESYTGREIAGVRWFTARACGVGNGRARLTGCRLPVGSRFAMTEAHDGSTLKFFVMSICAVRQGATGLELAHGNGLIRCAAVDEEQQKGLAGAHKEWREADGWTGHDVGVREVSRETLADSDRADERRAFG